MLDGVLHWLGFGLCHQLPERSFIVGGLQAPVCARDTGIYVGVLVSMVVLAALHKGERPRAFPRIGVWAVLAILVAAMGWDGVTSYAGIRESSNVLRLVTGLSTGFAVGGVIMPMLNEELWKRSGRGRVLDPTWRLVVWLTALPLSAAVLWWGGPMIGRAYPLLIAASIPATLTAVNLILVGMIPSFDRRAERWVHLLAPAGVALLLSVVEIGAAGLFRVWMIARLGIGG